MTNEIEERPPVTPLPIIGPGGTPVDQPKPKPPQKPPTDD